MIDAHVHLRPGSPDLLMERLNAFGARSFNALGVPALWGDGNNLQCLAAKKRWPGRAWAFGGLHWRGRHCPAPEQQLRLLLDAGFDGLKLLETKPTLQKDLGFLPDDRHFEAMFKLAEERQVPILWHVGDPASFWDLSTAPDFAVANGWTYEGEGFLSLNELYGRTERVLERHPKLRVILAHLYFCSDDRAHLERLLSVYPNLHIDITPGSEMYRGFAADQPGWKAFFHQHAGRILLGSDLTNEPEDAYWRDMSMLTRGILGREPFTVWDIRMDGFGLDEKQLAAITGGNFKRLAGENPKPLSRDGLAALMAFYRDNLDQQGFAQCEEIYRGSFA